MAVSLTKDLTYHREIRVPGHGDTYDLLDWEYHLTPLWWDDASYIRYQASDGSEPWSYVEFGFLPGEPVLVRRWVNPEQPPTNSDSRAVRRLHAAFIEQLRVIDAAGSADRATLSLWWDPPF